MKKQLLKKTVLTVFLLFFSTYFSVCHAQLRNVEHNIGAYCGTVKDQNNFPRNLKVSFFVDDKLYTGNFQRYRVGKHTVRVVIKPTPGNDATSDSYVIKKIEWRGQNNTKSPEIIQTFLPNKKEFSFAVDVNLTDPYFGYAIEVQVDICPGITNDNNNYTPKHAINEVRVVGLRPGVSVHKAGTPEDDWQELTMDRVLQEGDEISCDPDGIVILQFADQSTTTVRNTTQLKIASYFTEGGVVKTEILLKMGEVAAKVHKSEATKSDFRIKTPSCEAGVRGTIYSVRYDPATKKSMVNVEEGTVEIKPVNTSLPNVTLKAGQQIDVSLEKISKVIPLTGKIDLSIAEKTSSDVTVPTGKSPASWKLTEGSITGILTLYQTDNNLSGNLNWANNQKGTLESGYLFATNIMFTVVYPGDVKVVYTATMDESGMKMLKGSSISNKGTSSIWSAIKQ